MYILYSWQMIKRRRKKRLKEKFTTYKVFKNKKNAEKLSMYYCNLKHVKIMENCFNSS